MEKSPIYSVVVPVYNSQYTLRELFERLHKVFNSISKTYEVIFVNDCSRDGSWQVLETLQKDFPEQVVAIHLSRNFGQHNALMCGFNHVKGDFVITIDDDLQIPPEEILKLITRQAETEADLIYGVYEKKKHNPFRNLGSLLVQKVFQRIFKNQGDITSFKLFKSSLCDSVKQHRQSFVFIDGLLHWHTQYIDYQLVRHEQRKEGRSGYSLKKLLLLTSNLLFNFTTYPLKMIIYLGMTVALVSFLVGIVFIVMKIIYDVPLGFTALIVSIFFSTGILLIVLGVVGEYISRIYSLQNDKPQFSIRKKLGD